MGFPQIRPARVTRAMVGFRLQHTTRSIYASLSARILWTNRCLSLTSSERKSGRGRGKAGEQITRSFLFSCFFLSRSLSLLVVPRASAATKDLRSCSRTRSSRGRSRSGCRCWFRPTQQCMSWARQSERAGKTQNSGCEFGCGFLPRGRSFFLAGESFDGGR